MHKIIKINNYDYHLKILGHGPPYWLFLHGFLGSGSDFNQIKPTGTRIYLTTYGFDKQDLLVPATRFETTAQVSDLLCLLKKLKKLTPLNIVGYSMGARLALALALTAPPRLINKLILESGTAGLKTAARRKARQHQDIKLARQLLRLGLPAFVVYWEQLPLFQSQQSTTKKAQQFMHQQRLAHTPENMANSLRYFGTGAMPNFWPQLRRLKVPTILVTGSNDQKFNKIADQMALVMPKVERKIVLQAGHNVHFEQPQSFTKLLNQER